MAKLAAGVVCPRCHTERHNGGCECFRQKDYAASLDEANQWYQQQADSAIKGMEPWVLLPSLLALHRRMALKAGLTPDEALDDRMGLVKEWTELWPDSPRMVPRWRPFRRNEANHLPI